MSASRTISPHTVPVRSSTSHRASSEQESTLGFPFRTPMWPMDDPPPQALAATHKPLTSGVQDAGIQSPQSFHRPTTYCMKQCQDKRCKHEDSELWYCGVCKSTYCRGCWDYQSVHDREPGRYDLPHEKTSPEIAETA